MLTEMRTETFQKKNSWVPSMQNQVLKSNFLLLLRGSPIVHVTGKASDEDDQAQPVFKKRISSLRGSNFLLFNTSNAIFDLSKAIQ